MYFLGTRAGIRHGYIRALGSRNVSMLGERVGCLWLLVGHSV